MLRFSEEEKVDNSQIRMNLRSAQLDVVSCLEEAEGEKMKKALEMVIANLEEAKQLI